MHTWNRLKTRLIFSMLGLRVYWDSTAHSAVRSATSNCVPPSGHSSVAYSSIACTIYDQHWVSAPFWLFPLFPVARAPQPHCSRPTRRRRAPAPAPGTAASSVREAAKRLSLMRRAECHLTWTSVSFTPCGEVTIVTGRALRWVLDLSEEDMAVECLSEGDGLYVGDETPGLRDKVL